MAVFVQDIADTSSGTIDKVAYSRQVAPLVTGPNFLIFVYEGDRGEVGESAATFTLVTNAVLSGADQVAIVAATSAHDGDADRLYLASAVEICDFVETVNAEVADVISVDIRCEERGEGGLIDDALVQAALIVDGELADPALFTLGVTTGTEIGNSGSAAYMKAAAGIISVDVTDIVGASGKEVSLELKSASPGSGLVTINLQFD